MCDRGPDGAYQVPINFAAVGVQVFEAEVVLAADGAFITRRAGTGLRVKPTDGRVVVVRAGVRDAVVYIVVRQIVIFRVTAERELQDSHARKPERIAKLLDVGCDDAEVFSPKGKLAELAFQCFEKIVSGDVDPAAVLGSLVAAGNFPRRGEAAKVVD